MSKILDTIGAPSITYNNFSDISVKNTFKKVNRNIKGNLYKGLNVLFLAADSSACGHYRAINPAWYLTQQGANARAVQVCSKNDIMSADIIIAQRQYDRSVANDMLWEAQKYGKKIIYELDDNLHQVLDSSPVFGIYHQGSDAQYMVGDIIKKCDGMTVSTIELAADMSRFNKNIEVLANSIDDEMRDWDTIEAREDTKSLVVGWTCGSCFTPDTEILTEDGFKLFTELTRTEKVATLNHETGELEYQLPTEYTNSDYNGKIYQVEKTHVNLSLTPNHWMYTAKKTKSGSKANLKYTKTQAQDLFGKFTYCKKNAKWEGKEQEYITIPGYDYIDNNNHRRHQDDLNMLMDDWLDFFGFWIAEGWTSSTLSKDYKGVLRPLQQVGLAQTKDNTILIKYANMFKKYGINATFGKNGNQVVFCSKILHAFLVPFGKCHEKFIPKDILGLSSRQLKIMLDSYIIGDGNISKSSGTIRAYTSSRKLADNLVEIALKIGWAANFKNRGKRENYNCKIRGRSVKAVYDQLVVSFIRDCSQTNSLSPEILQSDWKEVNYSGTVHCVTVPNHLIYVRRKGVCTWQGNTHISDMHLLKDIMPRILNNYPNVKFGLYSATQLVNIIIEEFELDPDRVVIIPPRSFQDYPSGISQFDINLVPTVRCRFNASKSNLKSVEAGRYSIPSVVSKLPPYVTTIKHKVNGMVGMTYENIAYLIENETERKSMGNIMRDVVNEEFTMSKNYHLWPKSWERIIKHPEAATIFPVQYGRTGRNDPCPCGSQKNGVPIKSKNCICDGAWY